MSSTVRDLSFHEVEMSALSPVDLSLLRVKALAVGSVNPGWVGRLHNFLYNPLKV